MIEDWVYATFDVVRHANNELMVCCPFCDHDTKFHMYISTTLPVAHCFKCGWSGTHFGLVKEYTGSESYVEIWRQLESPLTMQNYKTVAERLHSMRQPEPKPILETMPEWFYTFIGMSGSKQARVILKYALTRLSMDEIADYGMGYCTDINQPYTMRLVIPIERGYFQARAISKTQEPKYINPEFPVGDRLFNYQALDHYKHVYICEGAISAIAIGPNAVATLGANGATEEQRRRLVKSKVEMFTLVVEPEPVAKVKAISMGDYLSAWGKNVCIRTYSQGDPADGGMYKESRYGLAYRLQP